MLKALAQLSFTFHGSREANKYYLDRFMTALEGNEIDFSHKNDLWKAYLAQPNELTKSYPGIQKYLTPVIAMQPYGIIESDTNLLRFGAASRDVSRYIGDLIRWKLELPHRPALEALVKKLVNTERLPQDALKIYEITLEELV